MVEDNSAVIETGRRNASVPSEQAGGASRETIGVNCPSCGGSLRLHEGERSLECEYCGSALFVTCPKGVKRFILPPAISAGKARMAALHHLTEKTNGRVKARHASIIDLRLIHVPFWRMHGKLTGWIAGDMTSQKEVQTVTPTINGVQVKTTYQEEKHPFSKLIFKEVDWSSPACSVRHLGLQGISLKARFLKWDVFDHKMTEELNTALPMKPVRRAEREGFQYLSRLSMPTGSNVRGSRFHLFGNTLSLYYYPVYILRYRHRGMIHAITIDGGDGRIIRGDIPKRKLIDSRSLFFIPAGIAFLASTWFPLIFIAAAGVYAWDSFQASAFEPPHRWLLGRLDDWFGGEM